MPIPNIPITPTDFDYLQQNVTDQVATGAVASALAQSGLQYVVDMNVIAPEVDLINAFHAHFVGIDSLDSTANYIQVVAQLNAHVVNRATTFLPADTFSTRLNRYLSDNALLVTQTYATISSGAGFFIDASNIEP